MRVLAHIAVFATGLSLLSSCTFDAEGNPTGLYAAALQGVTPMPKEVPAEVLAVQADPQHYAPVAHPLRDVPAGTVIDDLKGISGCWARYVEESQLIDGEETHIQTVEVRTFDLSGKEYACHTWSSADRVVAPFTTVAILVSEFGSVRRVGDKRIVIEGQDFQAGGVKPDGTIVYEYGAAVVGAINASTSYPCLVTVQGDYMKLLEGASDQSPADLEVGADGSDGSLWVRLNCE